MSELNINDIVLLIHGEVASAINSVNAYGQSPTVELNTVRVRMGQEPSKNAARIPQSDRSNSNIVDNSVSSTTSESSSDRSNISLNSERFPLANEGWMVDVTYQANSFDQQTHSDNSDNHVLPSKASAFLNKIPLNRLSGIGQNYSSALNQAGYKTTQQLAQSDISQVHAQINKLSFSQLRTLQTLAKLTLSLPATAIPIAIYDLYCEQLLQHTSGETQIETLTALSSEELGQLSGWIQQLEFCLDDDYFTTLTIASIMNG